MRVNIQGGQSTPLRYRIEIEDWEDLLAGAKAGMEEAIVLAAVESLQDTARFFSEELAFHLNRPGVRFTGQLASTIGYSAHIPSPPPDAGIASRVLRAFRAFGKRIGLVSFRPDLEQRLGEVYAEFGMIRSAQMGVPSDVGKNPYAYAAPVEFGSRPPIGMSRMGRLRIQAWAEARGFSRSLTRRIIGGIILHGTRAHFYFRDAAQELQQTGASFFRRAFEGALSRNLGV